jgi:hypothetical protein
MWRLIFISFASELLLAMFVFSMSQHLHSMQISSLKGCHRRSSPSSAPA